MNTLAMTISISADVVAWYAAIVATGSAAVTGYGIWRDRTKIKVAARPNMRITEPFGNFTDSEDLIFIQAANVGRRPVKLEIVWFEQDGQNKGEGLFVKSDWNPSETINEGESATMLCKQENLDVVSLKRVVVRDATGRKWSGRIENKLNGKTKEN